MYVQKKKQASKIFRSKKLTIFQRYGTKMSAMPEGALEEPIPRFLNNVGNKSAVNIGNITLDDEAQNLPSVARPSTNQLPSSTKKKKKKIIG